jgi:hypothetical protein
LIAKNVFEKINCGPAKCVVADGWPGVHEQCVG